MNELPSWAKKMSKLELARCWMEACEQGDKLYKDNARLRDLLRPVWLQWHGETFRPALPDSDTRYVQFTISELRAIAALFAEAEDG